MCVTLCEFHVHATSYFSPCMKTSIFLWNRLVVYFCSFVVKIEKVIKFLKSGVPLHILEFLKHCF